jgi:arylsulfatase A-like enzyme
MPVHHRRSPVAFRSALGLVSLLALLGACSLASGGEEAPPSTSEPRPEPVGTGELTSGRPNIVFILADDLDARISPFWDVMTLTRERLKNRGMTFSRAYTPTSICCAARAAILSGQYGWNTGVLTNGGELGGWDVFRNGGAEARAFPVALKNAGYRTVLIGKYLNGYDLEGTTTQPVLPPVPPGWTEWYSPVDRAQASYTGYGYAMNENGTLVRYGSAPQDYFTDVVSRKAVKFIQDSDRINDAAPLFMYVAPTAPHLPIPPAPRHANHPYVNALSPRVPNYDEPDVSDKPLWLTRTAQERSQKVATQNDEDYRKRMGSLYALDEMVASILDALAAAGELENTYVIFTSDNGYNLGAHRLIHKMAPYEESIQVPLVIAGPGIPAGATQDAFALHVDFAPTFLQLAGLPASPLHDGKSLVPLLGGSVPAGWRTDFPGRYEGGAAANGIGAELPDAVFSLGLAVDLPSYRFVRNTRYLYVQWYDPEAPDIAHELYDLQRDPWQLDNLLATPAGRITYRTLADQMAARLATLTTCGGAGCP